MKQQVAAENRKELETKMADVFGEKINALSTELQKILPVSDWIIFSRSVISSFVIFCCF